MQKYSQLCIIRLLLLVGLTGIGKTALAERLSIDLSSKFDHDPEKLCRKNFDDKNTPWPRLTLHSQDQTAFYISLGTFLMTVAAETIYHLAAPSKRSRAQRQASLPDPVEDHEALQASRANVLKGSTLPHFSAVLEYLEARVQVVIQDI